MPPLSPEDEEELARLLLKKTTAFDRRNEARNFHANTSNKFNVLNLAIDAYIMSDVILTCLARTRLEANGVDNETLGLLALRALIAGEQYEAMELMCQMRGYMNRAADWVEIWTVEYMESYKELDARMAGI